jgi:hypothetical protein
VNIATTNEGKQQIAFYGIAVGLALIVLAGGYFTYVKPAAAKASFLQTRIVALDNEARNAEADYTSATQLSKVQLADLFDLTRAMPDDEQVADILVVLGRLAQNSGVQFDSITPDPVVQLAGYQAQPMEVVLEGNYYDLMEFLYELRHLVDVRADSQGVAKLYATGRLFTINKLGIEVDATGDPNKPALKATINLDAFVYGSAPIPGVTPPPATTSTTTTTAAGSASAASAPTGGSQ